MIGFRLAWCFLAAAAPIAAQAQNREGNAASGGYFGLEAGLVEHHFYLTRTDVRTGQSDGQYYRSWGVGGGAFAGYDFAVYDRTVVGIEASALVGGAKNEAIFTDGTLYRAKPRFGYRIVGRLGRRVGDRGLAYVTAGYGGHRYRVETNGVDNAESSGHSFVLGAGGEYRVTERIRIRLDFKHLDNQSNQLLLGMPVRF